MKISDKTNQTNVDYMCEQIERIIVDYGDRDPGSAGELKALDHMANEVKNYTDEVSIENFDVHPFSFMGWTWIVGGGMILATLASLFSPLAGIIIQILSFIPMFCQFVFYKRTFDKLFKKRKSGNLLARKKPAGEIKRRIVLNGHSDAAYEWHWHHKGGFTLFLISIIGPIVGVIYTFTISIISMLALGPFSMLKDTLLVFWLGSLVFIPFYIAFFWFSNHRKPVPGANDNLTACYMAIGALKALKEENIELQNTEVCCLITGSEEAGLRGAKAWAKKHKDFDKDVETIFITYETLRELEHLHIYTRDLNSLVKNDMQVSQLVRQAGEKNGMKLTFGSVFCGATDSAAFSQAGFKSTAIAAMAPSIKDYYHTERDNYDNLSKDCLSKVLDITMDMLEIYDQQGLPQIKTK